MRAFIYNLATDKIQGPFAAVFKFFLFLLSLVYGGGVRFLSWFYSLKPRRLSCKVISVGNITLGGTGKTVIVEYLTRYLKDQAHKVAIITRGYRRKITGCGSRVTSYETMGDEPYMLAQRLGDIPVIVDSDRIRGAHKAIREHQADTIVLDDGFQQWKIEKDLDIAVIDTANPFGNRQILPRGILREPLRALKRAHVFILTKTNLEPDIEGVRNFLQAINPRALIIESVHQPLELYSLCQPGQNCAPEALKGKSVGLFAGIGDPVSFEKIIVSLGAGVSLFLKFSDHHDYSRADLEEIFRQARGKNVDMLITTEKDSVRLSPALSIQYPIPLLALRIVLKITKNEEGLYSRLHQLHSI